MHEAPVVAPTRKSHSAVGSGKEGVITATSNVFSRVKLGSALSDNDAPRFHKLTAKGFDSQHFGLRISSVSSGAHSFLMCHFNLFSLQCKGLPRRDVQPPNETELISSCVKGWRWPFLTVYSLRRFFLKTMTLSLLT